MTMTTNPAYTHFCFFSDSAFVRESLPLPSLYKDLISVSVEYVNPSRAPPHPPLCLSAHEAPTGPLLLASSLVAWWAWTSSPARLCVGQRRGRRRGAGRNPIDHPCHIWWTHWPLHWYSRWSGRASLPLHSRHILSKAHHLRLLCWISGVKKDLETVVLETGRHNYVQSQSNHTHILMCNNYTQDCIQSECIHRLTR